ncbi:unnamed protein product [Auanema sp. JU1783]|nr:unnamed protein product [Auanema sp. JU1783]
MPSVCVRSVSPRNTLPRPTPRKKAMKKVVPPGASPGQKRIEKGSLECDDLATPRSSTYDVREPETSSSLTSSMVQESRDSSNPSPSEARDVVTDFVAPKQFRCVAKSTKAKRLRFYRNGDQYFKGITYALHTDRIRSMQPLMEDLTRTMGDSQNLPHGIRHILSIDGQFRVTEIDQFEDGESYVCSSNETIKSMDYTKAKEPSWCFTLSRPSKISDSSLLGLEPREAEPTDFVEPRIITVIRNGVKPRKVVRHLLNRRSARSYDQVMRDLTTVVKLDSGAIRKLFDLSGRPVLSLRDFFRDDYVFIAYGNEKHSADDFYVISEEYKSLGVNRSKIPLRRRVMPNRNESLRDDRCGSVIPDELARHLPDELNGLFDILQLLGDGNTALVYEVMERASSERKALKIISRENTIGKESLIESELAIMKKIEHPYIVRMFDDWCINGSHYLSLELVEGGDLFEYLRRARRMTERQTAGLTKCLCEALDYLHERNIVHRDVKPENLILYWKSDSEMELKLADFGLATEMPSDGSLLSVICGTPTYVAAEVLTGTGYDEKVDIWATGIILYVMLGGFPPFHSSDGSQEELFRQIVRGKIGFPSPAFDNISWSVKDLILNLVNIDYTTRFSADQILNSKWIQTLGDVPSELEMMAELSVQARTEEEVYVEETEREFYMSRRASMDELSESGAIDFDYEFTRHYS